MKYARRSIYLFSFSYTTNDDGRAISLAFVLPAIQWKSETVNRSFRTSVVGPYGRFVSSGHEKNWRLVRSTICTNLHGDNGDSSIRRFSLTYVSLPVGGFYGFGRETRSGQVTSQQTDKTVWSV